MNLLDFGINTYSQFGEDGMISKVMEWLGIKGGLVVEFGAWEGYHFSNTAALWTKGWRAILIEGNSQRAKVLGENTKGFKKVTAIEKMVGIDAGDRWQDIDGASGADLVSIDVDGNDYWIFDESPRGPSLYIVEYNTSIPSWLDLYTPYAQDNYFGCSLGALDRIARKKGYRYIGATRSNGFFLRDDLMKKLPSDLDLDLKNAPNQNDLVYLMTSYGGEFAATKIGPYGRTAHYNGVILRGNETGALDKHAIMR